MGVQIERYKPWGPFDWQRLDYQLSQMYETCCDLEDNLWCLKTLSPFISPYSVEKLKNSVSEMKRKKIPFILIGDCAEEFFHADPLIVKNKIRFFSKVASLSESYFAHSLILARMAGQFAKPRSQLTEIKDNKELPSYFGDMFNGKEFNIFSRKIRSGRLIEAYKASHIIAGCVEAFLQKNHYPLKKEKLFFCHEALNLFYESSLTKRIGDKYYNLSTHMPWLGMRTIESASHVNFLSGIANPIGIKVGPLTKISWLCQLLRILNPSNESGKIILITRLGHTEVTRILPSIIEAIQKNKIEVAWVCDPMHGNTEIAKNGLKVRRLENILTEVNETINVHLQNESCLNGIHLEATYEKVTECVGGNIKEEDVPKNYTSAVDPRLNPMQTDAILKIYFAKTKKAWV